MQSYSYETIHMLGSDKILAINLLFTERLNNAIERLSEHGIEFFKERHADGSYVYYTEEELPLPKEYGAFEQVTFSEYRPILEAELHYECAIEMFTEWEAEAHRTSPVRTLEEKIASIGKDLPF